MKLSAIFLAIVCGSQAASAQNGGGGGGKGAPPSFHALVSSVSGSYHDYSQNDSKDTNRNQPKTSLSGTEVQIGGSYKTWELELGSRMLTPSGVDWWKKRNETDVLASYYWPLFPYVQPTLGLLQVSQSGDQSDDDAPPAFIDTNKAAIIGLKSSMKLYSFGTHGFMGQARMAYLTSFESKRNFGDEGYVGLGYFFQTGRFNAALVFGQLRNFFRAEKLDPDGGDDEWLTVRHTYVANRIGLYMEY